MPDAKYWFESINFLLYFRHKWQHHTIVFFSLNALVSTVALWKLEIEEQVNKCL